jgi:hypothetical protein
MAQEPLGLPDLLAGLPDEADYEAVYAAVMASERGRRFLTEYADRNRHADTQMLVGAIARVEAAIRGDRSPQASTAADDLMEIAATVERIEAAIASGAGESVDGAAALERIQDIAFMLHERPVEPTLCDGLDAALRELSAALDHSDRVASRGRKTAELLRALAGRVREISAAREVADTSARGLPPQDSSFQFGAKDDVIRTEAVAAPPEASSMHGPVSIDNADDAATANIDRESEAEPEPLRFDWSKKLSRDGPPHYNAVSDQDSAASSSSTAILSQMLSNEHFARVESLSESLPGEAAPGESASSGQAPDEGLLPRQDLWAERVAAPEEYRSHPVDPLPVPSPLAAQRDVEAISPAEVEAAPATPAAPATIPPPVELNEAPPQAAGASMPRGNLEQTASDPLAAVRALSEEELIALFS